MARTWRRAVTACVAVILVASCSGTTPTTAPTTAPTVGPTAAAARLLATELSCEVVCAADSILSIIC